MRKSFVAIVIVVSLFSLSATSKLENSHNVVDQKSKIIPACAPAITINNYSGYGILSIKLTHVVSGESATFNNPSFPISLPNGVNGYPGDYTVFIRFSDVNPTGAVYVYENGSFDACDTYETHAANFNFNFGCQSYNVNITNDSQCN